MRNLETSYMGLKLKNPIIVSSSGLTNSVEKIKLLEEKNAGAVVLKSLFEEQINFEAGDLLRYNDFPGAEDYILTYSKNNSVEEYLKLIREAKRAVSIPIIASINCVSAADWSQFAKRVEEAGADAIELNIYLFPNKKDISAEELENKYYAIVRKVKSLIKIPIAVKIGSNFTNLPAFVEQLAANGASAVVLFNRFYEPDIDIQEMKITSSEVFSNPTNIRNSLRWVGLISESVNGIQISASTGVHSGEAAIKQLLAGATTVQICSVIYKNGTSEINKILNDLTEWMTQKNFKTIKDFRGKMSSKSIANPSVYERAQFMKYFSNVE